MKLIFHCDEAGARAVDMQGNNGQIKKTKIYFAKFTKTQEDPQKHFGQITVESIEPMHYKPGHKYDITVGEHHNLTITNKMPKHKMN